MNEHSGHRQRMKKRFLEYGLDNFDDHNVLEILLFYALPRRDTNALAHRLMQRFGSFDAVLDAPMEELTAVEGMGENAALLLKLSVQTARRYMMRKSEPGQILACTEAVGRYLLPHFVGMKDEKVMLLCLDGKMKLLGCREVGRGDVSCVRLNLRHLVETALSMNAAHAVLAHNHISGIALASQEDRDITMQVRQLLRQINVELLDHIIVAGDDFVSMKDDGVFDPPKNT